MKFWTSLLLLFSATSTCLAAGAHVTPLASDYSRSTWPRWLAKHVYRSKLLDDCESLSTWTTSFEDQGDPTIVLTTERSMDGKSSLRLTSPTNGDKPIPEGRYYGTSSAVRVVKDEDWSKWNRISFWVYPDLPGFKHVSMIVILHNDGKLKVPDVYGKMGVNYVLLKNHRWNHIVWEIANLPRDKVTGLEFAYRVQGHENGATNVVRYDIDKIELQQVDADYYEGWAVKPGGISFSHPGYQTGSPKSAISSDLTATTFQLVDARTHKVVLTGPVRGIDTPVGRFQVMDFTTFTKPGTYIVRAGNRSTKPFRIGEDVWESSLTKAINFFLAERCGIAVDGVHDYDHGDWTMTHDGKTIVVNGGWHDAGDLSQNLVNTCEADYAMWSLAERLLQDDQDPALRARLIDEAKWGLAFIQKVSFHDGYRTEFNTMDRWTDNIIGTPDDMIAEPRRSALADLASASTEAIASRVLAKSDPRLAAGALAQAKEDWNFGIDLVDNPPAIPERYRKNPMARFFAQSRSELAGHAVIASIELWKSTHDPKYADKAVALAKTIVDSQQRDFLPGLTSPITGFFCTDTDKQQVLRYNHLSHEEAPEVALVHLCEAFPNDPHWIDWYSAATLYAQYYEEPMASFSGPYGMLGSSLYRDDEYKSIPKGIKKLPRESYQKQVLNGIHVGGHYYVRRFPVWFEFRGNTGTTLTQSVGLAEAAHLRGDYGLYSLLQHELEWVIGRNPFVESQMWGEGYDYAPEYTAMSGNIVGSLPVGIQTHYDNDAPYWPTENCHNWKEVWVVPTGRWIWLMKNLSGPATVEGYAAPGEIVFHNLSVDKDVHVRVDRDGRYRAVLPEGVYRIDAGGEQRKRTFLSGETYDEDLRPGHGISIDVTQATDKSGKVVVEARVSGTGTHSLYLRLSNLVVDNPSATVTLSGKPQTVTWTGKLVDVHAPWVGVVVPDSNLDDRVEITGDAFGVPAAK